MIQRLNLKWTMADVVVLPTHDGTWTARCPKTGTFVTGSTRETAAAELRRKIGESAA